MININLTGKRALVCGASQGIGRAAAIELAEQGATVTLLARNEEKLKKNLTDLPKPNNQAHDYLVCDLSDTSSLNNKITEHLKTGPIEILVNNAGGPKPGPISEASIEDFEAAMKMHLIANVTIVDSLLPGMKKQRYGRIINITSTSIKSPIETLGVSNTARWAVAAWAKTLSFEVAQYGITVNAILPGFIDTERLKQFVEHQAKLSKLNYDAMYTKLMDSVPAKRAGKPSEIAQAIGFLASPAAAYINGVALAVDGGRTHVL